MAGGGGSQQTTRQEIDPMLAPYVQFGLGEARRLYEAGPPKFFEGQTYVGPSAYSTQAIETAAQRAMGGSPLVSGAQQAVGQLTQYQAPSAGMYQDIYGRAGNVAPDATAGGAFLGMNPFLQGTFQAAARPISTEFQKQIAGIQSQASRAGRYGSGAQAQLETGAADVLAQNLAGLGERLGFAGYQQERGLQEQALTRQQQAQQLAIAQQLQAAGGLEAAARGGAVTQLAASQLAPSLAEQDYINAQRLLQAGQAQEAYQRQPLEEAMQRYQYQQMAPLQALQSYLGAVYGAPSGSVVSRPYTGNPLLGALGGAATGAAFGPVGAIGGGLLGYMGSR